MREFRDQMKTIDGPWLNSVRKHKLLVETTRNLERNGAQGTFDPVLLCLSSVLSLPLIARL